NAESWFSPEDPAGRAYMQDLADKAFTQFKTVVKDGRKSHPPFDPDHVEKWANGKAFMAGDALALGLIDKIGYQHDAYDYAASLKGLKKKMVVRYSSPPGFLNLFSSESKLAPPSANGGIIINGINI